MSMKTNTTRNGPPMRIGAVSRELALLMPALIVTVAICIDLGHFAFALKQGIRVTGFHFSSETLLFQPIVFTGIIAVLLWVLIICRLPRS